MSLHEAQQAFDALAQESWVKRLSPYKQAYYSPIAILVETTDYKYWLLLTPRDLVHLKMGYANRERL